MKILIDTNVLIDYVVSRKPFDSAAREVIYLCRSNEINGCIAAHTVLNMFYILRKSLSVEDRKLFFEDMCSLFSAIGVDKPKIMAALRNNDFSDFEDCVQSECAAEFSADYIVTRNVKDFAASVVPAITPDDFLAAVKEKLM